MNDSNDRDGSVILSRRKELATALLEKQFGLMPGSWESCRTPRMDVCLRDEEYHLSYLAQAIDMDDLEMYLDYIRWCKAFFRSINLSDESVRKTFTTLAIELPLMLSMPLSETVRTYLTEAATEYERAPGVTVSFLSRESTLSALAQSYTQALLDGRREDASRFVLQAAESGVDIRSIYLEVFQSSQREIGRLWQTNRISVAQEHYCTAATQMIMSRLYPWLFGAPRAGRSVMVACVGGELHELGARMVADFFELEGWDSYYLGANTPTPTIVRSITERKPDLLAVSTTLATHVGLARDLVATIKEATGGSIPVLIGGAAFLSSEGLWTRTGADAYAPDAGKAVAIAMGLCEEFAVRRSGEVA